METTFIQVISRTAFDGLQFKESNTEDYTSCSVFPFNPCVSDFADKSVFAGSVLHLLSVLDFIS